MAQDANKVPVNKEDNVKIASVKKQADKYDYDIQEAVYNWVNSILGTNLVSVKDDGGKQFEEDFGDGKILCQLINALDEKDVSIAAKIINKPKQKYFSMDRVTKYCEATEKLGFNNSFKASDLANGDDLTAALTRIYDFGCFCKTKGLAQAKGGIDRKANLGNSMV